MASQRNRGPRGGQRTGGHDTETMSLWNAIQEDYRKISQYEALAAEVSQQIIDKEREIKDKEPTVPSLADLVQLEELYRRGVKLAEEADAVKEGHGQSLADKIGILTALKKSDEEESSMAMGRNPSSRQSVASSAMDLDGSADSPMASPAPRKLGGSGNRVSSQPPTTVPVVEIPEKEDRSETGSNNSKTKITFAVNDEVAFKPKQQPGQDATDWIQGIVTKVIGEGKSRRYDVKDPYPSEGEVSLTYRSSASSMVPVPRVGTQLPDFEVGREVLGLYPGSSCFYRAEVKAMKGDKVELLFEDDEADTLRLVERRFVLDYRVTKDGKK